MIVYQMFRKSTDDTPSWLSVADVLVLGNGKCIVAWPTSVIVYDSEEAARAVHITHMGGRGQPTEFRVVWSSIPDFMRGVENAMMDSMENAPWGVVGGDAVTYGGAEPKAPDWETLTNPAGFLRGYMAEAGRLFGPIPRAQEGNSDG